MDNSFASVHPELVCEWSSKNAPLQPFQISFNMLVLVGSVKISDRIVREMMGL